MNRPLAAAASAALALGTLLGAGMGSGVVAPPSAAAAPYCGITWGSLTKWKGGTSPSSYSHNTVKDVRSGRHACFDRMVIDVRGEVRGYLSMYLDQAGGNGLPYQMRGSQDLVIELKNPSVTRWGHPSWDMGNPRELADVSGYRTFRQIGLVNYWSENGDGEPGAQGVTTIGIGVRARLPFRVFVLDGPGSHSRVVVDVAHRW